MEASGAGLSQGGDGAAQQGQQGEGEGTAQQFDPAAVVSQLEANTGTLEEMRNLLQQHPALLQPQEAEAPAEEFDTSWLGDDTLDPQVVGDQLQKMIDARADERVKPLMDRLQQTEQQVQERVQAEQFRDLTNEFPELQSPETAQQVVQAAQVMAETLGQPDLAYKADFVRLAYMAGRAADAAQREGTAPDAVNLEGAAGAGPGGGQQVDPADLIVNAGQEQRLGARVLDFG